MQGENKDITFSAIIQLKFGHFLFYQRKALIARVQGVLLLITETITHIKDNCRVIA